MFRNFQPKISSTLLKMFLLTSLVITVANMARGQEQTPSPSPAPSPSPSDEERRLEEQIRILTLKKTRDELKKDIREAQPQPSTTPLEGKAELDDEVKLEAQIVTYKAMSNIADKIAYEIKKSAPNAKVIAIYHEQEISDWKYYRATYNMFEAQIEDLQQQYVSTFNALQPVGAAAVSPLELLNSGTTILRSFVDLISIFRTDTTIAGISVTVEEKALVAETFRALRNKYDKKITLYYPLKYPPETLATTCVEKIKDASGNVVKDNNGKDKERKVFCSPTLQKIAELYAFKNKADQILISENFRVNSNIERDTRIKTRAEEKIAEIKAKLTKLREGKATDAVTKQIQALENEQRELEQNVLNAETRLRTNGERKSHLDRLIALNREVDQFITAFAQKDDTSRRSNLLTYLRAESLDIAMKDNESYWFSISSISAGGNNRIRKNLVFYPLGAKIDHSGGIIVEWQLYRKNGASIDSNVDRSYEGYKSPKSLKDATGSSKDKVKDPEP